MISVPLYQVVYISKPQQIQAKEKCHISKGKIMHIRNLTDCVMNYNYLFSWVEFSLQNENMLIYDTIG